MLNPQRTAGASGGGVLRHGLLVAGHLWTLPNTVAGLLAGMVAMPFGARLHWSARDGAVLVAHWPWGPGGAITIGGVILHTGASLDVPCRTYEHMAGWCEHPVVSLAHHERAHVLQYCVLGPLFVPVYFMLGGVSVRNPLERAADRYALTGRGWWPWGRCAIEDSSRF